MNMDMESTWAFEHRHGIKGNIQGTWICNEYLHRVNTGTGTWAQDKRMQQLFSSQGSPGKLMTPCLWQIKGKYWHGINTGMGTRADDETMQQLLDSQGSGGGAPGKLRPSAVGME